MEKQEKSRPCTPCPKTSARHSTHGLISSVSATYKTPNIRALRSLVFELTLELDDECKDSIDSCRRLVDKLCVFGYAKGRSGSKP